MLLADIIQSFRDYADDLEEPYLWSSTLVNSYADQAEEEACTRRPLLTSSTNATLCDIAVTSGTALYSKHGAVREVYVAKFVTATETHDLTVTNIDEHTSKDNDWESRDDGIPDHLLLTDNSVQLVPPPNVDGTIRMSISHVPLEPMSTQTIDDPLPTIDVSNHKYLVHWMLHLAYSKRDADTHNQKKALEHERKFIDRFGESKDVNKAKSVRTVRPDRARVASGWI